MTYRVGCALVTAALTSGACATDPDRSTWPQTPAPIMTRWAAQVSPEAPLPEYPRPQTVRDAWVNLNGMWDYAIRPSGEGEPVEYDGRILVPFPVESALSGVMRPVGSESRLWYRRTFARPNVAAGRTLLHFGAMDWRAVVWVNGQRLGEHMGGYDPFTFDITSALTDAEEQLLVVSVWDPSEEGPQPRGKQVREPEGIWYTAVTGIWQTVWLEPVPAASIASVSLIPDLESSTLRLVVESRGGTPGLDVRAIARNEAGTVVEASGEVGTAIDLVIDEPRLWSPDDPFLYDLDVSLQRDGEVIDRVASYFGMRSIAVMPDEHGRNRMTLNGEPLFQLGPLDQGWWPDGLYTAPTDEALRYDIEVTKRLGFNLARKHVKVEPARWYYHADTLGLLVWLDMPSGDRHLRRGEGDIERTDESARIYRRELEALISTHLNHPSIVAWVPFNEGWGQFDTDEILAWTKLRDPSRLVDGPSGWEDRGSGDILDIHQYPGPTMPPLDPARAAVLGEFGGLGLPLEGHLWWDKRNWGYRTYQSVAELTTAYERLFERLEPLVGAGLAGAIYTQTTDVEGEVNGLMTYDREVIKLDPEIVGPIHRRLYSRLPRVTMVDVMPTSERAGQTWRYTMDTPASTWMTPAFDAADWSEGEGGFGGERPLWTDPRTSWTTSDIWLRMRFELAASLSWPQLRVLHVADLEIFVNGVPVASLAGSQMGYQLEDVEALREALTLGSNTIAVHAHRVEDTGASRQFVDVGITDVVRD